MGNFVIVTLHFMRITAFLDLPRYSLVKFAIS